MTDLCLHFIHDKTGQGKKIKGLSLGKGLFILWSARLCRLACSYCSVLHLWHSELLYHVGLTLSRLYFSPTEIFFYGFLLFYLYINGHPFTSLLVANVVFKVFVCSAPIVFLHYCCVSFVILKRLELSDKFAIFACNS